MIRAVKVIVTMLVKLSLKKIIVNRMIVDPYKHDEKIKILT